jgi:phosphatidylserine/phosphatidylglycerophosphate/cardiolipin synthase-like enzyme/uncharacterized membrane protein YdjX (TVP38/TMEM64 family)
MAAEGNRQLILQSGRNCWRICRSGRLAVLVDAAAYFEALRRAIDTARRTVFIAGWDIDSRTRLQQAGPAEAVQPMLSDFLNEKARTNKHLRVFILGWDFPMLYVREREWLPMVNLGWKTHRRVAFHLDDEHPLGASQHQKFVVIDDKVAFCGGLDLADQRWDTPEHRPRDSRRVSFGGRRYGAFHDLQMAVDGEAAACLGELFRLRWQWATGARIRSAAGSRDAAGDPWPAGTQPLIENTSVGIVRTLPAYKDRPEIAETRNLYQDAIAAAEQAVYIENQYLTSADIVSAFTQSLQKERGPEIVLVIPQQSGGWLEQNTMDRIRNRMLVRLRAADRHNRLKVCHPIVGDPCEPVYVHAKAMVVDDRLLLIGSANLSNRSMGLDSECNLALEAGTRSEQRAIAGVRAALLAEHLGATVETVCEHPHFRSSLRRTIESLGGNRRDLRDLDLQRLSENTEEAILSDPELLDPEKPVAFDRMIDRFSRREKDRKGRSRLLLALLLLGFLVGMAAAWRWTPLSEWLTTARLIQWARHVEESPMLIPAVVGAYVVGGIVMVPVTLLVGATAVFFSSAQALVYALMGCLASAAVCYAIGAVLGKQTVRKLGGKRLGRLNAHLRRRGILTVVMVRNLPVAPFTIVNLVAGASRIRFRDFMIGTAAGMLPGIAAISVFADRLAEVARDPSWENILVAAAVATALAAGFWWAQKRLRIKSEP